MVLCWVLCVERLHGLWAVGLEVSCLRYAGGLFFMGWAFESWEWAGLGSEYGWVFAFFCGERVLGWV